EVSTEATTTGRFTASVLVRNTGDRKASATVQLYGRDPVASVTRPVVQLLGYARVELAAGAARRMRFDVPVARVAFSDRRMSRIVDPGDVQVWAASHAEASAAATVVDDTTGGAISNARAHADRVLPGSATPVATVAITGDVHEVTAADRRLVTVSIR